MKSWPDYYILECAVCGKRWDVNSTDDAAIIWETHMCEAEEDV